MTNAIQTFAEKASFFFVILFGVLLPYNMLYATIAIYPIIFFSILSFRLPKRKQIPRNWWIFTVVFLLTVLSSTYTNNTNKASFLIERQLLIFIFPLVLPLAMQINQIKIRWVFIFFTASCFASVLYLLYPNIVYLDAQHWNWLSLSPSQFYNHSFTKPIGIHATYLSLYVALSVIFLLDLLPSKSFFLKLSIFAIICILAVGLFFMASRNTILTLIFITLFIYPILRLRHKLVYIFASIVLIGTAIFVTRNDNYIFNRFSIDLIDDLNLGNHYTIDNPEPRIMRWQCAIDLIKEKPIFGYGSGDEIPLLMKLYKERNMKISYAEEFNTHNQYLSILIKHGVVGLLIFLGMLAYFFRLAIESKNFLYLSFLILMSIGFLTENIIDANKGIFFFAYFNTLLGYQIINENKQKQIVSQA